jgi:diguanylate cyclase (GGDEF)-like protein
MEAGKVWSSMRRHRRSITDFSILLAGILVVAFLCFEIDVFLTQGSVTRSEETLELDEVLLLGGLLASGMLVFSYRRYREQRRETQRRMVAEQTARELAFQDGLTGLPNRRQFDEALKAALAAPPRAGAAHGLLLLDLNGFKQINDVYGHGVGDEVLIVVAHRLMSAVRDGDLVARFGGDEFAILARHLVGPEAATNVALRFIQALEQPIRTDTLQHQIGAGIGIALLPEDATTADEALRKADVALYRAKAERRSAMRFFEEHMDERVRERNLIEQQLRVALSSGAIETVFHPNVDLKTRAIVGFEAVPRWTHPTFGEVPAERFIPIAEEAGIIHELAERQLLAACAAARRWPEHVTLAIDLFPSQLKNRDLKARVLQILAENGLAPQRLEIEITESALVQDLEAAQELLGGLRKEGVRIALDNFGTGYSSLYHLRNFKLDKIKIDRSFISSMVSMEESAAIVNALVGLGEGLGLTVAAEGIDDTRQSVSLLGSGCEQGQGRFFSGAITADATAAIFAEDPKSGLFSA